MIAADSTVDTTLIAVLVVAVPVLLAIVNGWQQNQRETIRWNRQQHLAAEEKRERQEVAAQAAEAAEKQLQANASVAATLAESKAETDARLDAADAKLDGIHTLVNSDMTAARVDQRDGARVTLTALRKIIDLDRDAGREPTSEDLAVLDATAAKIQELDEILADRHAQQVKAEADAKLRNEGSPG